MPAGHDNALVTITVDDVPLPRVDIELSDPPAELQLVNAAAQARRILALVRLHGHPLGTVVLDGTSDLAWQTHASTVWSAMSEVINAHLIEDGLPAVAEPNSLCATTPLVSECARRRAAVLASAPPITVIVATRERPNHLRACLNSLLQLEYPAHEIVVVDNDPVTDETARLIEEEFATLVRYVRENRRGLAWAHNCGLREVQTDIVAFTDDDVLVDRHWLTGIAEGFAADADVACVTGLILPEQLDTPAQLLLHQHGGFDKGFAQRIFDMDHNRPDDPLFPFTAGQLGSGANMAFATEVLRRQGGFDPALGIGTKACGGDDVAAFFRVVLRHRLAYHPAAIVWHRDRRDMAALRNQASSYGVGTGAFLTSVIAHEPRMLISLLRRLPAGIAFVFRSSPQGDRFRFDGWPRNLERLEKLSILSGLPRYAMSSWRARRLSGRMTR
jgi:glycosyltransferase involved in cell wall biosynthesis